MRVPEFRAKPKGTWPFVGSYFDTFSAVRDGACIWLAWLLVAVMYRLPRSVNEFARSASSGLLGVDLYNSVLSLMGESTRFGLWSHQKLGFRDSQRLEIWSLDKRREMPWRPQMQMFLRWHAYNTCIPEKAMLLKGSPIFAGILPFKKANYSTKECGINLQYILKKSPLFRGLYLLEPKLQHGCARCFYGALVVGVGVKRILSGKPPQMGPFLLTYTHSHKWVLVSYFG